MAILHVIYVKKISSRIGSNEMSLLHIIINNMDSLEDSLMISFIESSLTCM